MALQSTVWSTAAMNCTEGRPAANCSAVWPDSSLPTCSYTEASLWVRTQIKLITTHKVICSSPATERLGTLLLCLSDFVYILLKIEDYNITLVFVFRCGGHPGETGCQPAEEKDYSRITEDWHQSEF